MKNLTDTQKKWALVACLASVLSLNMVLGLAGSEHYATASLASTKKVKPLSVQSDEDGDGQDTVADDDTEPEENKSDEATTTDDDNDIKFSQLITNKGKQAKVKYQKKGDQTIAIVGVKTESAWCFNCNGAEKFTLSRSFSSSALNLEAALRKAMSKDKTHKEKVERDETSDDDLDTKVAAKRKKHARDNDDNDDEKDESKEFADLRTRCDKKDDDQNKLSCYVSGLTKLLKDKKKTFPRDEVLSLFKDEIEVGLRNGLKDVSDLLPRRASRYGMDDLDREDNTRRQDTQALVEDMLSQIGKKYNYLRERLVKIAANAVLDNEQAAQLKLKQAESIKTTDPQNAFRLQYEGQARLRAANQVANDLGGTLSDGLGSAQWSSLINQDQFDNMYYNGYANIVNQAIKGMTTNPLTYTLPSVSLADGTTIIDQNGNTFSLLPTTNTANPLAQNRTLGRGITVMANNLTAANVVTDNSPRILGGAGVGTATITPLSATTAAQPMVRLGVRGN